MKVNNNKLRAAQLPQGNEEKMGGYIFTFKPSFTYVGQGKSDNKYSFPDPLK